MGMSIEVVKNFFSGLYNVINEDLNQENLIKKGAPVNEILELTPEVLKEECEKQFMQNVFEAYFSKNEQLTNFYNDMYDTLLKWLKTNPEQFEGYKKEYPVITSYMIIVPLCDKYIDLYKDYLSNM